MEDAYASKYNSLHEISDPEMRRTLVDEVICFDVQLLNNK